jgi:ADP-ribose pyrophosphatase
MENIGWKFIKSIRARKSGFFKLRYDYLLNLRNDKTLKATIMELPDSVNIVAITQDQKILMVRQYRFGIQENTIELPGGLLDPNEDHATAARRELLEETGFTGGNWQYMGKFASLPGFISGWIHSYVAVGVEKTHDLVQDDGENIAVVQVPIAEARQMLADNAFAHPHAFVPLARVIGVKALDE